MNGNMYVADDLELAGRGSSVTLQGNYYGYNFQKNYGAQDPDSAKKAEFSSAMMVNGKSSHLDIKGLNYLLLAGRTFISRKLDASNEDILMGESISRGRTSWHIMFHWNMCREMAEVWIKRSMRHIPESVKVR